MDKLALSSSLAALENSDSRPKSVQFREIYPQIEKALSAGASYKQVLEAVNKHSQLALSTHTFRGYLDRTRKRLKLAPQPAPSSIELLGSSLPAKGTSSSKSIESSNKPQPPAHPALKSMRNAPVDYLELSTLGNAARKAKK